MPRKIYKKKKPQSFFTKNGKELKSYQDYNAIYSLKEENKARESVSSLTTNMPEETPSQRTTQIAKKHLETLREKVLDRVEKIKQADRLKISMISLGVNAALLIAISFLITNNVTTQNPHNKYALFSSKPLTSLAASSRLFGGDPRAATIDKIMGIYNCPLEGKGRVFVTEADKYNIPYWLVAAISFQESSCGKVTPRADGQESYNAWGWGVWGPHVRTFENWDEGIRTVSR
jgi:hypothetical protein